MAESGMVHTAGDYFEGIQLCVICGGIIVDDRGAMIQQGQRMPGGFPEGPVTINGNMRSAFDDEDLPNCKPS